ncbi:MAG: class I SAM-dependent methyltransferase [Candidatus Heimdallarchaeaceae archaeon]|jgi:tRNA (guanine37-N1)-methyltransferase
MEIESVGIKIANAEAESLRKWLLTHEAIDHSLSFIREEEKLVIPLNINENEAFNLLSSYESEIEYKIDFFLFAEKPLKAKNLQEAVANKIPESHHEFIPKAYDQIGDIAIVEIPDEISEYKEIIGESLLNLFPSIICVYRKASAVSGQMRIRELDLIAGEKKCETTHLEHGIRIFVNVCETYFSPRLGEEHKRVADEVEDNETIVDLFTGVGSFPLHIAKRKNVKIYAIDINETAIECLKKSIPLNKLKGEIIPLVGDSRDVIKTLQPADRVIMNLPSTSLEYLDIASQILKPEGILHFYHFISTEKPKEKLISILGETLAEVNRKIKRVINFHKVRESAPFEIQASIEVSIEPIQK